MIPKNTIQIIVGYMILFLVCTNAGAIGIGLYTTATNSGSATWDDTNTSSNFGNFDADIDQTEFGFVLDTAIAKNRLYNYRLQIAKVDVSYKGKNGSTTIDMDGFVLTNTFGFGVVRKPALRFWIGPQIAIKKIDNSTFDIFNISLGGAAGLNYHIGDDISLIIESGFRYGYGYTDTDIGTFDVTEDRFFVNVGLLFRFGDQY